MGAQLVLFDVVLPWLVCVLPLPFIFCRDLDTLGLGENKASTLGVTGE